MNRDRENSKSNNSTNQELVDAFNRFEKVVRRAGLEADQVILPVRQTILKRYPVLSVMLVTLGVAATFLGLEKIVAEIDFLNDRPWLIFLLGIGILTLTGNLYKKLG